MSQVHIEYLEKVLEQWDKFCKTHRKLAEAIRELLKDAKALELLRELLKDKTDHE